MKIDIGPSMMLIAILAIMALAVVLWLFESVRHLLAIFTGLRKTFDPDGLDEGGETDDDPYDVGINDKDIL